MYQIGDYTYSCGPEDFLGEGSYGKVFKCKKKNSDQEFCLKIITKYFQSEQFNAQELEVLQRLKCQGCPNIVQIYDIYDKSEAIYIIMEKCDYDLQVEFKELSKKKIWYSEEDKIAIIQQIMKGCSFLSSKNIIHRDIKPTNILIKIINRGTLREEKIYKITDFGFSKLVDDIYVKGNLTRVGTKIYSAPQLYFENVFSGKCDIFSYGILFYQVNYDGKLMFDIQESIWNKCLKNLKFQPLKCEVKNGKYGQQMADLIEKMLLYDEEARLSIEQILNHPILKLILISDTQDSVFKKINVIVNREYIQQELQQQKLSRIERIGKILDIFYRKYLFFDWCQQQIKYVSIENAIVSYTIAQLGLKQLNYAMGMINGSISDIHQCFRSDNDLPNLLEIIAEYNQTSQQLFAHKQLKGLIKNAYFSQKNKILQMLQEIVVRMIQYPMIQQPKSSFLVSFQQLIQRGMSQSIDEKFQYELIQQAKNNNSIIDDGIISKILSLEKTFPIQNYLEYSPDDIFQQ